MRENKLFYVLIAFCFINLTHQISFKAVNDPYHFLALKDLHDIQEDIKAIERYSGMRVTLFVTNNLANFKQQYNLNASFNVYDNQQFLNSIYNSMYPVSSSGRNDILIMFSLDNKKYNFKLGSTANTKISTYTMNQFFEKVKTYFLSQNFSKGIREYIDEIEDYFEDRPSSSVNVNTNYSNSHNRNTSEGSGSAALLIIFGVIIVFVAAACCFGKATHNKSYSVGKVGKVKRKGSGSSHSSKSNHNDDRYRNNYYGANHDEYGNYDRGAPGYQDQGHGGYQDNMGSGGGTWGGNEQGGNWNANYQGGNENQGTGGGTWGGNEQVTQENQGTGGGGW